MSELGVGSSCWMASWRWWAVRLGGRPNFTPRGLGSDAALACTGPDQFTLELGGPTKNRHIRRPCAVVVSAHLSPKIGTFPSPKPIFKLMSCLRSGAGVPVGFRATAGRRIEPSPTSARRAARVARQEARARCAPGGGRRELYPVRRGGLHHDRDQLGMLAREVAAERLVDLPRHRTRIRGFRARSRLASRVSTWPRGHFCRSAIAPR